MSLSRKDFSWRMSADTILWISILQQQRVNLLSSHERTLSWKQRGYNDCRLMKNADSFRVTWHTVDFSSLRLWKIADDVVKLRMIFRPWVFRRLHVMMQNWSWFSAMRRSKIADYGVMLMKAQSPAVSSRRWGKFSLIMSYDDCRCIPDCLDFQGYLPEI